MKVNLKKIKLIASTNSARVGTLLFSAILIAILVSLFMQGILNFDENLGIAIGAIAASAIIVITAVRHNFGGYILFDPAAKEMILCRKFKKQKYSLEVVSKVQLETKTFDLHVMNKTTEHQTKSGAAIIKQEQYKKVHYKVPFCKNMDQRKRYEAFAEKCNKVLKEVIHKKQITEIARKR